MPRVRLVSWKPGDAEQRAALLRSSGHDVDASPVTSGTIRELPGDEVDAFVVDLDRLPSQGRDVGVTLRRTKGSRHVPLVFAGGAPEKVERVRALLPDATFADWDEIGRALERAVASPPSNPVVPESNLAAYSSTPLPQKLGIKEGSFVCLEGAPEGFSLRGLPDGAVVRRPRGARPDHGLGAERGRGEARLGWASRATRRSTTSGSSGRRRPRRSLAASRRRTSASRG